jgi:hypothetical protein
VTAVEDVNELGRRAPGVAAFGPKMVMMGLDAVNARRGLPSGENGAAALKDLRKNVESNYSPEFQEAGAKEWWDSKNKTFGPAWSDPNAYAKGVLESLPEQVLTMFPAMRLAKGAFLTKLAATGDEVAARKSAALTAQIAGSVGEGALAGAQSSREVRDEIMGMSDDVLMQSDAVKALVKQGMTVAQAKRELAENGATKAFVLAGFTTGMFGGMGDRVLAKAMLGGEGGILRRTIKGAVSEGLFEEFPQSYLQQVSQNIAALEVDPKRDITAGAMNQALGGLAIGGVQGGGQTAIFGRSSAPGEAAGATGKEAVPDTEVRGAVDETAAPPKPEMTYAPRKGMTEGEAQSGRVNPVKLAETDAGNIDTQLQNRDRDRAVSVAQMADIAAKPDFDRLAESPIPDVGAPMVSVAADADARRGAGQGNDHHAAGRRQDPGALRRSARR